MNIAIIGRTEILYKTAELLLKKGHNIKLIITAKEASGYTKNAEDFKNLAKQINCKYLYTSKISSEKNIEFIKNIANIDIGISMNYVNIISQQVINLFPYGILNAHGGDLPRYRGNACQAWAIINGEKKIALCIHKMIGDELDSGDIIERKYMPLTINTKIGECFNWLKNKTPDMFVEAVEKLSKNKNYILENQSKKAEGILRCYPRNEQDGKIDWTQTNTKILRLINASGKPYAGAFCSYDNEKLIICDAELYNDNENYCAVAGQIAQINKNTGTITVITGKGKLLIKEISYDTFFGKPAEIIKSIRKRLI